MVTIARTMVSPTDAGVMAVRGPPGIAQDRKQEGHGGEHQQAQDASHDAIPCERALRIGKRQRSRPRVQLVRGAAIVLLESGDARRRSL